MDKIATLQNCIVTLGSINARVDQKHTVVDPCVAVIQAISAVVQEMQKEAEDANKDEQGT